MYRCLLSMALCAILSFGWANARTVIPHDETDNYKPYNSVTLSQTNLPIVFINVGGQQLDRENKTLAWMCIINNEDGVNYGDTIAHPSQTKDYEGYIALKYRGNSSFYASDKKPLSVRPLKASDVPENGAEAKKDKVVIMGMGKKGDNDWCLLAPWEDKTYMRDLLTMDIARPFMDYVPQGKYCEVVMDGTYYGVFIMCERNTKGKDRLNLNDPGDDNDFTGDFHVEIDRPDEPHYYTSKYHPLDGDGNEVTDKYIVYQYKDFEYEDYMDEDYLSDYPGISPIDSLHASLDAMEASIKSDDFADPDKGYRKYIDVNSFIDYEIVTELSNNVDGYRLSTPLYKYSDTHAEELGTNSRWKMGLWDYNRAYGNAGYYNDKANIMRYKANSFLADSDNQLIPFWWTKLMSDPAYVSELKARWAEYRQNTITMDWIKSKLESFKKELNDGGALSRDNEAWTDHFGTIDDHISTLESFINNRIKFLDIQWSNVDVDGLSPVAIESGFNADVIAENTPAQSYVTNTMDNSGNVFYSSTAKEDGAISDDTRQVKTINGNTYQLNPYTENNALLLKDETEGTLTLENPIKSSSISYIVASADGATDVTAVVNYSDGTSVSETDNVADWYSSTLVGDEAVIGLSRVGATEKNNSFDSRLDFRLFEYVISTDATKEIVSVTFSKSGGNPSIFGLAAKDTTTGIKNAVQNTERKVVAIYTVDGQRLNNLRSGLNIVKYSDGTVEKIIK